MKNKSATIRGRPSQAERQRLSDDEEKRIEKQRRDLGQEGLKKREKELEDAIAHNEVPNFNSLCVACVHDQLQTISNANTYFMFQLPPPESMLRSVAIPDASSINFHPIERFSSDSSQQHPNLPLNKVPVFTQVDHVHTNFIYVSVENLF